jgi:hypothetical protein
MAVLLATAFWLAAAARKAEKKQGRAGYTSISAPICSGLRALYKCR